MIIRDQKNKRLIFVKHFIFREISLWFINNWLQFEETKNNNFHSMIFFQTMFKITVILDLWSKLQDGSYRIF